MFLRLRRIRNSLSGQTMDYVGAMGHLITRYKKWTIGEQRAYV